MAGLNRRSAAAFGVLLAGTLALAACGGGDSGKSTRASTSVFAPKRIMRAPRDLLSAAEPQGNGTMWMLAGTAKSRGLFQLDPSNGQVLGSISVSAGAQSVAQTSTGLLGLGLGTQRSGALELLDSHTGKVKKTISLPAPAREVVVGSDGSTLYVLTGWPSAASVIIVDSGSGARQGTVPVPRGTASVVPNVQQSTLYALQGNGLITEIGVAGGRVRSNFKIGSSGTSLAISPDGNTLYALKDAGTASNIAVVDAGTESVRRALPAPAHCVQVLVAPSGDQLYDIVGTQTYGNVQVFPL